MSLIEKQAAYRCTDGRVFHDLPAAQQHEFAVQLWRLGDYDGMPEEDIPPESNYLTAELCEWLGSHLPQIRNIISELDKT